MSSCACSLDLIVQDCTRPKDAFKPCPYGVQNGSISSMIVRGGRTMVSCVKKKSTTSAADNGFEDILKKLCEETQVAELSVKFKSFEIHLKRKNEIPSCPAPGPAEATSPAVPVIGSRTSRPIRVNGYPTAAQLLSKSVLDIIRLKKISAEKANILDGLKSLSSDTYAVIVSPRAGMFCRAKTHRGEKRAPACDMGDDIKAGDVIGYVEESGEEFPVNSNVSGTVLKFICCDGETVGVGDPLVAILY